MSFTICYISLYGKCKAIKNFTLYRLYELCHPIISRLASHQSNMFIKASRMKEIACKRQGELEQIFARAHIEIDTQAAREKILGVIDSGSVEPFELLVDMGQKGQFEYMSNWYVAYFCSTTVFCFFFLKFYTWKIVLNMIK